MSQANTEKFWKKVAVSVVATLVGATIIGSVTHWWQQISAAIESSWNWFLDPVSVPRLWYYILFLYSFALTFVLAFGAILFWKDTQSHYAYTEDKFFDLLWRWNWDRGQLTEPIPYCPVCKRLMRCSEDFTYNGGALVQYKCQGCSYAVPMERDHNEVIKKIRIEIRHSVETGLWKQAVKRG